MFIDPCGRKTPVRSKMLPSPATLGAKMQLTLRQQLTRFTHLLQSALFPVLEEELGEISDTNKRLIAVLNLIPLARFIPSSRGWKGRAPHAPTSHPAQASARPHG